MIRWPPRSMSTNAFLSCVRLPMTFLNLSPIPCPIPAAQQRSDLSALQAIRNNRADEKEFCDSALPRSRPVYSCEADHPSLPHPIPPPFRPFTRRQDQDLVLVATWCSTHRTFAPSDPTYSWSQVFLPLCPFTTLSLVSGVSRRWH